MLYNTKASLKGRFRNIRGYGGIGRRARFRSVWRRLHAGSTPVIRTKEMVVAPSLFLLYGYF